MNRHRSDIVYLLLAALSLAGCEGGANPNVTHEGQLLNNDVLQQRVEAAFRRGGADYSGVRAHAEGGTVVLTGSVTSGAARSRAEGIARGVYGVKEVKNEIDLTGKGR